MQAETHPPATDSVPTRLLRAVVWLLTLPLRTVALALEAVLSRRGLAVAALLACVLLTLSPWLRPPLHRDLRAQHIPFAAFGASLDPGLLTETRVWRLDSLASPLLVVSLAGIVAVLLDPRRLPYFSGPVAAIAMACSGAAMLNHPRLIEQLDIEHQERVYLHKILGANDELSLTNLSPSRVNLARVGGRLINISNDPLSPQHGWHYLVWGPWLVLTAAAVTAAATPGNLWRRSAVVCAWLALGAGLTTLATHRRLIAEARWREAGEAELQNDFERAAQLLDKLAAGFPDFTDTSRMLLTRGRVDFRRSEASPYATAFVANQNDPLVARYKLGEVLMLLPDSRPVRNLAATACFLSGKISYTGDQLGSAERAWAEASTIAPWRLDCRIAQAVVAERIEGDRPQLIAELLTPVARQLGDRLLRADIETIIGDSYFESGKMAKAREYYSDSMDTFSLPRFINPYAQEAMLGM